MFPWFTGRNNERTGNNEPSGGGGDDNSNNGDDEMMPYAMELDDFLFQRTFRAFSSSQLPESNLKEQLEFGGKSTLISTANWFGCLVLLPQSALQILSNLSISYPMIFRIRSKQNGGKETYGGVLEFSAAEGVVYLPDWMFKQLGLTVGGQVEVTDATVPLGTFIKIQPQSVAFLDISDPRAVLEVSVRNYTTLTKGDTIPFKYNDRVYEIAILQVSPDDGRGVIGVVETDLQVDFAPPVGYEEPSRTGSTRCIASSLETQPSQSLPISPSSFSPFSGTSNRLFHHQSKPAATTQTDDGDAKPPVRELQLPRGTIVFPQPRNVSSASPPLPTGDPTKKESSSFTAFTGKSNKLQ